jgi:hypothetical protein
VAKAERIRIHSPLLPNSYMIGMPSFSSRLFLVRVEHSRLEQPQDYHNDSSDKKDAEKNNEPADASRSSLFLVVTIKP